MPIKLRMAIVSVVVALATSLPVAAQDSRSERVIDSMQLAGAPTGASAYRIH